MYDLLQIPFFILLRAGAKRAQGSQKRAGVDPMAQSIWVYVCAYVCSGLYATFSGQSVNDIC